MSNWVHHRWVGNQQSLGNLQSHTDTSKAVIVYPLPLIEWWCLWERNFDLSQKIAEDQENLDRIIKVERVDSLGLWQTMKVITQSH